MKKTILLALSGTLLLTGCGETKNENADSTTKSTKFVSEKEVKSKLQKYVDEIGLSMQDFQSISTAQDVNMEAFNEVTKNIDKSTKDYEKYLDKNKEPIKYTKPSEKLIELMKAMSGFMKETGSLVEEFSSSDLSLEDFEKKSKEIEKKYDKQMKEENFESIDKFLKDEKIDTSKMDAANEMFGENEEESNNDDSTDSFSINPLDDFKSIKNIKTDKLISAGPIELKIESVDLGEIKVTDDNSYNFETTQPGEKAQIIILNVKMKNTEDSNVEYYADQAPITTDTGEQLDPSVLTGADLVTEMKGDIESTGKIIYELKNSTVKDINSIDFIAPEYNDPETYDTITPEQKITIEIK